MTKPKILEADDIKQIHLPIAGPLESGKQQRYSIYIPSPEVIFQLGKALGASDPGNKVKKAFGFDGVSLRALDNLYIGIGTLPEDGPPDGHAVIDVGGTAVFQSRNMLQQWAGTEMLIGALHNMSVYGGGRIIIGAGFAPELAEQKDHGELAHGNAPESYEKYLSSLEAWDTGFGIVVDTLNAAKLVLGGFLALPTTHEQFFKMLVSKGLNAYEWEEKARGRIKGKDPASSELVLVGKEEIGLFSDKEIGLVAEGEVKLLGMQGVKITSGLACKVEAGIEAGIFAVFGASLGSAGYTEVTAGRKLELAALKGPVEIKGEEIAIGNELEEKPPLKWNEKVASKVTINQAKTKKVEVGAHEEIKLVAEDKAKGTGKVDIKAEKKVSIQVGEYFIHVAEDGIVIGHSKGKHALVKIRNGDEIVIGRTSGGAKVEFNDDCTVTSADSASTLSVSNRGTEVKTKAFRVKSEDMLVMKGDKILLG